MGYSHKSTKINRSYPRENLLKHDSTRNETQAEGVWTRIISWLLSYLQKAAFIYRHYGKFWFPKFQESFPKFPISPMEVSRSKLSLFFIIFIKITENELCNWCFREVPEIFEATFFFNLNLTCPCKSLVTICFD